VLGQDGWRVGVVGSEEEERVLAGEFFYFRVSLFCCVVTGQVGGKFFLFKLVLIVTDIACEQDVRGIGF
jgi:hypothetical protein